MLAKHKEREAACRLRKEGCSLSEISAYLGVSKSSASGWTRHVPLSKNAQKRLMKKSLEGQRKSQETHRARTQANLKEASLYAKDVLKKANFSINHVRIACALLYWCEGEKSINDKILSFTNSDPFLAATFVNLLRKGFSVNESKFRICVHLHDYHNTEEQLQFWSQTVNIPRDQFMKPYHKAHSGKQKREGYAGCASIRYYNTHLARRINAIAREFLSRNQGPIS